MKRLLIISTIFLLLTAIKSYGQHEADYWPFGYWAGLNYYSGTATGDTSKFIGYEGGTAISDGCSILFYTDGDTVYDRNHNPMPNGFGLAGKCTNYVVPSGTQSALAVSQPGSDSLFYIFTTDCVEDTLKDGLRYSIVDMSLNGGLGNVTIKNQLLLYPSTEKVVATRHANGCDIWVLGHEYGTNAFYAFLLTNIGISATIVSNSGQVHGYDNQCKYLPCFNCPGIPYIDEQIARGYMKFSMDGSRLILLATPDDFDTLTCDPVYGLYPELFTFDNSTGVVAQDVLLADTDSILYYGASFSPDNSKLYLSCGWFGYFGNGLSYLHQFHLNAGNSTAILNSRTLINDTTSWYHPGAMQLAYDGKIYFANDNWDYVGAINNPNAAGLACNYNDSAVGLPNYYTCGIGLPNFLESYFTINQEADFICSQTTALPGATIYFTDNSTGASLWEWDFGDGNYAATQNTSHAYSSTGIYTVTLTINKDCHYDKGCKTIVVTKESAITDHSDNNIASIYPNPFTKKTTIEFKNPKNENYTLKLYDSQGRIVQTITDITTSQVIIEKDNLTNGLYFFQLRTDKEICATGKLIVK